MKPLLSIVIPTYNRARDLERALKSILAQTYSHWEVVIIDNHSTDDTDALIRNFCDERIRLFKIHNEGVIAASRNLGIKSAQGEYIAFLDSDDWWMPQKLEESVKYLEQGADVVYHDLFLAKKSGQRFFWKKARARDLKKPMFDDLIINGNAMSNSSVVVSRKILQAINGFSEDRSLITAEDYVGWIQISKHTDQFKKIPKTLGYLWVGGGNVTTPERTISSLDRFENLYADDIKDLSKDKVCWFNYAKGRAHYILRSYGMAKKNLDQIRRRRAPLFIKLKTYWMLFLINLYQRRVER